MIRVVIADDEPLAREGLARCLEGEPDMRVVAQCSDGIQALEAIRSESPALALLDIRMPGLDGLEVVEALDPDELPAIVFVTAHEEYAVRAFEESAVDYVLKPIVPERVARAVRRARDRIDAGPGAAGAGPRLDQLLDRLRPHRPTLRRFAVPTPRGVTFLATEEVGWIESDRNYVRLHTPGATHRVRETLAGLEERLGGAFVRIHRSLLVRVDRIRSLEPLGQGDYVFILDDGTRLSSSRSYRSAVRRLLSGIES